MGRVQAATAFNVQGFQGVLDQQGVFVEQPLEDQLAHLLFGGGGKKLLCPRTQLDLAFVLDVQERQQVVGVVLVVQALFLHPVAKLTRRQLVAPQVAKNLVDGSQQRFFAHAGKGRIVDALGHVWVLHWPLRPWGWAAL